MTRLLLVRHGQSLANARQTLEGWGDSPLSEQGQQQAALVAERLLHFRPIAALYTSPLRRAAQTAAIIGQRLGLEPIPHDELRELNMGRMDGTSRDWLRRHHPLLGARWLADDLNLRMPGGESLGEHRERALAALRDITARHPDETVVVVSHGGTLATWLLHAQPELGVRWSLASQLANGGLTILDWRDGKGEVVALNEKEHLN